MALKPKFSEVITVGGTAIGITSILLVDTEGRDLGVIMTRFQHKSGGDIQYNDVNTPVATENGDDWEASIGTEWEVWGYESLSTFKMIAIAGQADGVVVAHGYGGG